jgi:predicted ATP-grasp superfamily ATP-dependent carboligase
MRLFVYEYVSGGGMWGSPAAPEGSLLREGAAMLRAVVADFSRLSGRRVTTTWDARLDDRPAGCEVRTVGSAEEEGAAFRELASSADETLVIAPECGGVLLDRVRQVADVGGQLLGPGAEFVAMAGDKHLTGERLAAAGVATPFAVLLGSGEELPRDFPYPAVLKPRDGAGSQEVYWIGGPRSGARAPYAVSQFGERCEDLRKQPKSAYDAPWRLEQFCYGMAASIALLCGPAGSITLPACRQILSDDGRFRYLGGSTPLAPSLHARAANLAHQALNALPAARGYIGFDLVLGGAEDGSQDVVIEINPRLTTSYVGLRATTEVNLAGLMVQTAKSTLHLGWLQTETKAE